MILPINQKASWTVRQLNRDEWQVRFEAADIAEFKLALNRLRKTHQVWPHFNKSAFFLDKATVPLLRALQQSEKGRGFALLRGLNPVEFCSIDLENLLWGMGLWLGHAVPQNRKGELIKYVKNDKGVIGEAYEFHTDRCDTLVLFYVRTGQQGGNLKLASVGGIYNYIAAQNPELAVQVFDDLPQDRRGEEGVSEMPWMMLPIMAMEDGALIGRYNRRFIESTQRFPEAPRLLPQHIALLDSIDEALKQPENILEIAPQPGDILLVNNHYIWHARTAYLDGGSEASQRLVLRLWLANQGSPRLPKKYELIYGSVEPGAIRGGVPQTE